MGHHQDNAQFTLHVQAGWDLPELILRHHRGDKGQDWQIPMTPKLVRELEQAALMGPEAFYRVFKAEVPFFAEKLPRESCDNYGAIFRFLGALNR